VNCSNPSATLAGSGGGTYSWDNGAGTSATPTVSPSNTTTYTVTLTGANGCTDTDAAVVTVNGAIPVANAGADFTTNCITPAATLSGSGGGNYSWNNGAGTTANPSVNPAITTTYTLTVTDPANGCTDTDAIIITVDEAAPTASAGASITLDCATTTGTFTASGGGTYSWASPNGTSVVAGFSVSDADTPGNYTVTVTTANGCTDTDVTTLAIDQADPFANAGVDQTSSCAVPAVTLDGSASSGAGITYLWTGPNVTAGATTNSASADVGGTYTLVVTGSNSCTNSDQVDVLPDLNLPIANAGPDLTIDCNNPSVNLDGSASEAGASITYSWTTAGGNITGGTAGNTATADLDGTYTITVTNSGNGCTATDEAVITQDTITPVISVTNANYVIDCNNPTATFDASASSGIGNSFNWTSSDGNIVNGSNTDAPIVDESGTYALTITSANGCTNLNSSNITVTVDTISPSISINIPDTLTCNVLQIVLDASGSQSGVTYNWTTINGVISTGAGTDSPTINQAGSYTLTITAPNGCVTSATTSTVDSEVPIASILADITEGEIDLNVNFNDTSTGMGLTYYWDFGTDNMDFDTITPAEFTFTDVQPYEVVLTVTDQYGCTATDTVMINTYDLPAIEVPNIFTPNGDGVNDVFQLSGRGVKKMNARIINRWGQLFYEWDSPAGGWDGYTISGVQASPGTYFYIINVDFHDGHTEEHTGQLMLKR
jgi:gliding motility-associated-like protein